MRTVPDSLPDCAAEADQPEQRDDFGPGATIEGRQLFTAKQGQYLTFIYYYTKINATSPAEADFRRFFRVTPPVVHQMIKTLHERGFTPGPTILL